MKIDIPDTLYQSYAEALSARPYFDSVDMQIQRLIQSELRRLAAPGYGTDSLTGCKTNYQLQLDVMNAMWRNQREGQELLSTQYLCIDIDDFKHFLDEHGLAAGDEVLVHIAKQLIERYTAADVYRFGGDEFVVHLGSQEYVPLEVPAGIQIKHSVVDVDARINSSRSYHLRSLIMASIHRGAAESDEQGKIIVFRYPEVD